MNETFPAAMQKSNIAMVDKLKIFSLNLVEKWRKIRESTRSANEIKLRPKLLAR